MRARLRLRLRELTFALDHPPGLNDAHRARAQLVCPLHGKAFTLLARGKVQRLAAKPQPDAPLTIAMRSDLDEQAIAAQEVTVPRIAAAHRRPRYCICVQHRTGSSAV